MQQKQKISQQGVLFSELKTEEEEAFSGGQTSLELCSGSTTIVVGSLKVDRLTGRVIVG
ncbi:MAG: hypothetical protein V7L20_03115 [Nostoc sp.]|uniref:hypothetical protein n=1 Tax=Nostoc sp. TaxID=1180 RepID=UPI002FF5FAEA